ncbi:cellulose synthase subunit BcsC-related outer membrane protein [Pseudomonas entomophila]|uniref:cellulose biosynthesis protein BcsC n=1 Tax=Pseudomonas entomophila TaxID=312306 RepID=UPI0023D7F543|nr:cellulose biosynthesis protein BcsC [Pseudomonas entomophila]MDF0734246.1 cellulose synthase subunit BcsC-related outer membrane protein [Pseudomonas entomophila]
MFRKSPLTLGLLAVLVQGAALAESSDPKRLLVEQGLYWQAEDKPKRAAEVWNKLLLLDASSPEALYGLGLIAVKDKQLAKAGEYLNRLQALSPAPQQAALLAQDIRLGDPANAKLLEQARLAVDNNDRPRADQLFRQALGNKPGHGLVGREFYNNLGFLDGQWPEARAGFERLLQERPDDPYVSLFLAKHLVRREDTREEGVRALERLAKREDIGGDADETWRLALTWLGAPNKRQQPLFESFLKAHPDDTEIRALLAKGGSQADAGATVWRRDPQLDRGLKALERGDQATAERELSARLKTAPNDADALGGLGVLRQQQNRLEDAEVLLARAVKAGGKGWQKPLEDVRYWSLLQRARDSLVKGRDADARAQLQEALRIKPQAPEASAALADVLAARGDNAGAETLYRQVLQRNPNNAQARRGLAATLARQGKQEQALREVQQLPADEQSKLGGVGQMRADLAMQQARLAEQRGDSAGQRAALEEALRNDPNNTWARFGLARLYLDLGASAEARSLMDGQLQAHPNDPDALYTSALFSMQQGEWGKARELLSSIPPQSRNAEVNKLLGDLEFRQRLQEIDALNKRGSYQEARVFLSRLEPLTQGNPERQSQLASAYADAKDPQRALTLLRGTMAGSARVEPGLMLRYAGVLLQAGQTAEVDGILRDLQGQALDPEQRRQYDDLLFLQRVRKADTQREQGDLAAAYDTLAPALALRPQDPLAGAALARMYAANGDTGKALEIYRPLVQRNPGDARLLVGAADVAAQQRDDGYASQLLEQALKAAPDDPDVLSVAARIYRFQGRTEKAAELLGRIVRQEDRQQSNSAFAAAAPASAPGNPFAKRASTASVAAAAPVNPFAASAAGGKPDPRAGMSEAAKALSDVLQERSAYVAQGLEFTGNDSESGLGRMANVQAPFEASMPVGDSRVALRVTPVSLNAGSPGSEPSSRFGAGPLAPAGSASPGSQKADGVGVAVAFENKAEGVKADIGTTPQGFLYSTMVGGVSVERPVAGNPDLHWGAKLSRRAVTDSVLSFAGAEDKRTGQKWGGVTANGGRLELGYDDRQAGAYVYGSLHSLRGHHVETNTRAELGSGVYWYLQNTDDTQLTAGLSFMAMGYEKNLGYYTYGHGGYFSPQSFFALGVPVSWARRFDRLTVSVKGSVGVQFIGQDSADYFPGDSTLQAAASAALGREAEYESDSKTGIGYSLAGAAEYQLGRNFILGGHVGLNNAQDYREWNGGMYVRYLFEDQYRPMALPVSPYRSPYSN